MVVKPSHGSGSSILKPIWSEDTYMKLFPGLTAHCWPMLIADGKKGLIECRIHQWPTVTYLSSSWSCKHILLRTKVTISVPAAGSMVVVRRKNGISSWHVQVDASDLDMWLSTSELHKKQLEGPTLLLTKATTTYRLLYPHTCYLLILMHFMLYTSMKHQFHH